MSASRWNPGWEELGAWIDSLDMSGPTPGAYLVKRQGDRVSLQPCRLTERGPVPYVSKIVCVGCWNERHPDQPAPAHCTDDCGNVDPEPCGYCGKETTSGIFLKMPAEKAEPGDG